MSVTLVTVRVVSQVPETAITATLMVIALAEMQTGPATGRAIGPGIERVTAAGIARESGLGSAAGSGSGWAGCGTVCGGAGAVWGTCTAS